MTRKITLLFGGGPEVEGSVFGYLSWKVAPGLWLSCLVLGRDWVDYDLRTETRHQ